MKSLCATLVLSLTLFSCAREQEKSTVPFTTEKTIFEEVKEQTVKDPKDAEAWYHLADLYERSGMYHEELEALKKVVSLQPDKGFVYVKLGTVYSRLGQYQDAIKNLTIAKKYFPKNPLLYNNLAVAYGKVGKIDEEIRLLNQAISLRPNYATARYNLGMVYLKLNKPGHALQQHQELQKFDAGTAQALKKEIDAGRK